MTPARYWAVVPAAGRGKRFGGDVPKQYLPLAGRAVLEHSVRPLVEHVAIGRVVVALSQGDPHWSNLPLAGEAKVMTAPGGAERCHSVLNALNALADGAADDDWVLVHDAARPCLHGSDLDRLISELSAHAVGGLLAVPVADTLKRCDSDHVVTGTVDRQGLWRALTPQMFRLGPLRGALERALEAGYLVTDESSAMEYCGYRPQVVAGRADNIKITHPDDLQLADLFLARQWGKA